MGFLKGGLTLISSNRKREGTSSSCSTPRYDRLSDQECSCSMTKQTEVIKKGYVPLMIVGEGEDNIDGGVRFLIPTQLMNHPSIVTLLDQSAEEFGYAPDGVIRISCKLDFFRRIVQNLPASMKTVRDVIHMIKFRRGR